MQTLKEIETANKIIAMANYTSRMIVELGDDAPTTVTAWKRLFEYDFPLSQEFRDYRLKVRDVMNRAMSEAESRLSEVAADIEIDKKLAKTQGAYKGPYSHDENLIRKEGEDGAVQHKDEPGGRESPEVGASKSVNDQGS